jgi:hypothetical protein
VAKASSSNTSRICRFCGLDTTVPHANTRECIDALEREKNRLTQHLRHCQLSDRAATRSTSDWGHPQIPVASRRFRPVRSCLASESSVHPEKRERARGESAIPVEV